MLQNMQCRHAQNHLRTISWKHKRQWVYDVSLMSLSLPLAFKIVVIELHFYILCYKTMSVKMHSLISNKVRKTAGDIRTNDSVMCH